jgi:hypothetical protein
VPHHRTILARALPLVAFLAAVSLALGGCENEPDRSLIGQIDNSGGGGTIGGGGNTPPALRAVALQDDLLFGSGSPHASGSVWVLAEVKAGHNVHRVEESVGGGPFIQVNSAVTLVDANAVRIPTASGSNWIGVVFATNPTNAGAITKYRVAAFDGPTGIFVYSNEIDADLGVAANPGVVSVTTPATGPSPPAAALLTASPPSVDFISNATGVISNLVVLVSDRGEHHTMVEEQTAGSHAVGTPGSVTYQRGFSPLPAGTWGIAVIGIDRSGWGISTSADPTAGPQHWFRVP